MGAQQFTARAKGKTAKEAFSAAVAQAQYDYGHAGYTGTIAEKRDFFMLTVPADLGGKVPCDWVYDQIDNHPRLQDKWGPAACIDLGGGEWLFFGLAAS